LLTANNALIYGTIYATDGEFSGDVNATNMRASNQYKIYVPGDDDFYNGAELPIITATTGTVVFGSCSPTVTFGFAPNSTDTIKCYVSCEAEIEESTMKMSESTLTLAGDTINIIGSSGDSETKYSTVNITGRVYVGGRYEAEWTHDKSGHGIRIITPSSNNTTAIYPVRAYSTSDAVVNIGSSNARFKNIYASNGTIQTSDRNQKTDFNGFTEQHEKAYMELKPVTYKFKNVADTDNHDRTHYGLIAQDAERTLTKYGFSTEDAGFLCKDSDESGNSLYGLRYAELVSLNMHMIQNVTKRVDELEKENQALKQIVKNILSN
jgi:hypothetical protein